MGCRTHVTRHYVQQYAHIHYSLNELSSGYFPNPSQASVCNGVANSFYAQSPHNCPVRSWCFGYRREGVRVTHHGKLGVVLHGLGLEALQHVGNLDRTRRSKVRRHAALSPYPLPPLLFSPYSSLLAAADGVALPPPAGLYGLVVSNETVPADGPPSPSSHLPLIVAEGRMQATPGAQGPRAVLCSTQAVPLPPGSGPNVRPR